MRQRCPRLAGALVAAFGTTISPNLFFWQASQESTTLRVRGQFTLPRLWWILLQRLQTLVH